jgi:hypothetical protein
LAFRAPPSVRQKKIFNATVSRGYCPARADLIKATNSLPRFWISLSNSGRAIHPFRLLDLAAAIEKRFAITAHPRSIERALGRQEKKRRRIEWAARAEPQTPVSAYEDLRQQAVDGSRSGGLGMVLFLGQGMVAWMRACSWVASTAPDNLRRCPSAAAPLPNDLRSEVVLVLAVMALNQAPGFVHEH